VEGINVNNINYEKVIQWVYWGSWINVIYVRGIFVSKNNNRGIVICDIVGIGLMMY